MSPLTAALAVMGALFIAAINTGYWALWGVFGLLTIVFGACVGIVIKLYREANETL